MFSKIITSHARVTKLWLATDRFWKNPTDEKRRDLIQFLNGMCAGLAMYVTDEEWNTALQVAADSLKITSTKGTTDASETAESANT